MHLPSEYPKGWDCMRTVMGELARAAAPFVGLGGAERRGLEEVPGADVVAAHGVGAPPVLVLGPRHEPRRRALGAGSDCSCSSALVLTFFTTVFGRFFSFSLAPVHVYC